MMKKKEVWKDQRREDDARGIEAAGVGGGE